MTLRAPARIAVLAALALVAAGGALRAGDSAAPGPSGGEFTSDDRAAIARVLDDQVEAWNRGDLEGFMEGYWESEDLVFTSGGRVQRGWRTTLDRYRATYGDRASSMGRLSFTDLEIHALQPDAAWALGRWALARSGNVTTGGIVTLVLRERDGEWKIVHDHTSVDP